MAAIFVPNNQHSPNDLSLKIKYPDLTQAFQYDLNHIRLNFTKVPGIFQTKWRDCGVRIKPRFLKKRDGVFVFYGFAVPSAALRFRFGYQITLN